MTKTMTLTAMIDTDADLAVSYAYAGYFPSCGRQPVLLCRDGDGAIVLH